MVLQQKIKLTLMRDGKEKGIDWHIVRIGGRDILEEIIFQREGETTFQLSLELTSGLRITF